MKSLRASDEISMGLITHVALFPAFPPHSGMTKSIQFVKERVLQENPC